MVSHGGTVEVKNGHTVERVKIKHQIDMTVEEMIAVATELETGFSLIKGLHGGKERTDDVFKVAKAFADRITAKYKDPKTRSERIYYDGEALPC